MGDLDSLARGATSTRSVPISPICLAIVTMTEIVRMVLKNSPPANTSAL